VIVRVAAMSTTAIAGPATAAETRVASHRLAAEHAVASEARDRGSAPFAALRHALLGEMGVVESLEQA
jgi:hypothetical protein